MTSPIHPFARYPKPEVDEVPTDDACERAITAAMRNHAEFMTWAMERGYRPMGNGLLVCDICFCLVPATAEALYGHEAWHATINTRR